MEQTLAIIKPDGVKNAISIIDMLYKNDLKIRAYQVKKLNKEVDLSESDSTFLLYFLIVRALIDTIE